MTALRLDAEAVKDQTLARRLGDHIAVLQRSIDAIVREARRPVRTDLHSVGDFAATVRERTAFWQVLADDQDRPTEIAIPEAALTVPVASATSPTWSLPDRQRLRPHPGADRLRGQPRRGGWRGPSRGLQRRAGTGHPSRWSARVDRARPRHRRRTAVGPEGTWFGPGGESGPAVEVTLPLSAG